MDTPDRAESLAESQRVEEERDLIDGRQFVGWEAPLLRRRLAEAVNTVARLETELAALKARRCETCRRWDKTFLSEKFGNAICTGNDGQKDGMWLDYDSDGWAALRTKPAFSCAAWEARDE